MNSKAFRTVCIIMIIFGILGLISGVTMLSGTSWNLISAILNIINNILFLVAAFIGIKAVKTGDETKAGLCKKLSYALIAIAVVTIVVGLIGSSQLVVPGFSASLVLGMTIIGGIISLILPVLYFLGAKKFGE